jgi:hypothetical protein
MNAPSKVMHPRQLGLKKDFGEREIPRIAKRSASNPGAPVRNARRERYLRLPASASAI